MAAVHLSSSLTSRLPLPLLLLPHFFHSLPPTSPPTSLSSSLTHPAPTPTSLQTLPTPPPPPWLLPLLASLTPNFISYLPPLNPSSLQVLSPSSSTSASSISSKPSPPLKAGGRWRTERSLPDSSANLSHKHNHWNLPHHSPDPLPLRQKSISI